MFVLLLEWYSRDGIAGNHQVQTEHHPEEEQVLLRLLVLQVQFPQV